MCNYDIRANKSKLVSIIFDVYVKYFGKQKPLVLNVKTRSEITIVYPLCKFEPVIQDRI